MSLLLGLEETDWAHVPGRYAGAGVARWWPKPPRDRTIAPDHTAIRCYGRLLLFENPKLVNDTLQQRVNLLIQNSNRPGSDNRRLIVILASIAEPLGRAGISLFAISTFDTDYVLVAAERLEDARLALSRAGHIVC